MIDALLWVVYLLLGVVTGLAIWSACHSLHCREKEVEPTRGVPSRTIAYGTAALLLATLAVTFLLGSSKPLLVNGEWFKDVFWLKLTDMFIFTALVELVGLVVLMLLRGISRRTTDRSALPLAAEGTQERQQTTDNGQQTTNDGQRKDRRC